MTTVDGIRHYSQEQPTSRNEERTVVNVKTRNDSRLKKTEEQRKKTNWRQLFIICSAIISAYLLIGEHAQSVCNVCTTVPAAIFTYRQLSDRSARIFAYKATLFYWSVHGILVAFDSIFTEAFGYFFGKFILLVVLFFNVVYQHDTARNIAEQEQKRQRVSVNSTSSGVLTGGYSSSIYTSQTDLNTALSITDATQFSIRSPYGMRSPIPSSLTTAFSLGQSPQMTAYSDTTYTHDASLITVASTEGLYKFETRELEKAVQTASFSMSDSAEATETETTNDGTAKAILAGDYRKAGDQAGSSLRSSDYSTSLILGDKREQLVTDPDEYIVFKYPFTDSVTVYMTNKHIRPIMWILRTNAIQRLFAQPTRGILYKDSTVHIKVALKEAPPEASNTGDRIAIDYCLVDDDTVAFDQSLLDRSFLDGPFGRRKKLIIYYEN